MSSMGNDVISQTLENGREKLVSSSEQKQQNTCLNDNQKDTETFDTRKDTFCDTGNDYVGNRSFATHTHADKTSRGKYTQIDDAAEDSIDLHSERKMYDAGIDDRSEGSCDVQSQTDDVSTVTEESVWAPDGGWGWVVTAASFMVAFIVDGMVSSFGLVLPELLLTFDTDLSTASFAPAIIVAMFLLSGPLAAHLVKRWGCRPVGFCGGLLAALGVAGSAYAPNIHLFIVAFGVVAGVGVGLIYLPSITIVNLYFHKKRGMVAGIVTSGSGFGLLAMAPLTEWLMGEFGWRGCYLIMAGITLNFCVCASLMRPLTPPKRLVSGTDDQESQYHIPNTEETCVVFEENLIKIKIDKTQEGSLNTICSISHSETEEERELDLFNVVKVESVDHKLGLTGRSPFGSVQSHNSNSRTGLWSSAKNLILGRNFSLGGSHAHLGKRIESSRDNDVSPPRSKSHGELHTMTSRHKFNKGHVNAFSAWLVCQVPPALSRHSLASHHSARENVAQMGGESPSIRRIDRKTKSESSNITSSPQNSVLKVYADQPKDLIKQAFARSMENAIAEPMTHIQGDKTILDPCTTLPLIDVSRPTVDLTSERSLQAGFRVARWFKEQRAFILFLTGAFLVQLMNNIAPLLTPSYAYAHGIGKDQVATILSVFGLSNTVGRLLAGVLVYWGWRALRVHNLGNLLSGVACFLFPLATTFPTITVCLGLHGLFLGAFAPLQSVILVEYLGIERLASTFGTMCLVKAFASSAGAPLAGLLYTATGVYTIPIAVFGAVSVMAAFIVQLMECFPTPSV